MQPIIKTKRAGVSSPLFIRRSILITGSVAGSERVLGEAFCFDGRNKDHDTERRRWEWSHCGIALQCTP